jgi:UDP-GlcNAc:undecaprenyl-phosphate GlcNAc-1-phosphate transferase
LIYAYEYIISLVVAFIVSFAFTPVVKRIAFKFGAVDVPTEERKIHTKPMARLGGLAILSGFLAAVLISAINYWLNISDIFEVDIRLIGLVAGAVIVAAVGVVDDIKALSARVKLIFQIAASLIVVFSGTKIEVITNPFSEAGLTVYTIIYQFH